MKSIVSISMLPEQVATPDNYVYFLAQAAQIPTKIKIPFFIQTTPDNK